MNETSQGRSAESMLEVESINWLLLRAFAVVVIVILLSEV